MTTADLLALLDVLRTLVGPGLWLMLAMLAVELLNLIAFRKLNGMGIVPREAAGLGGILVSPFLHTDLRHFLANVVPLAILAFLLGRLMPEKFWWITGAIVLGTGLLVWLLARKLNHVGASGLIYGLFGYLTLHGFLSGQQLYLGISVVLLVLYSGLLWGALPTTARTSWESHLAGLAVGLGLAWKVF
jgi:membrane associated rhomboid family serine protease